MKVAVLGAGGREHALCRKIAASPLCEEVICVPGNAGMERDGIRSIALDPASPALGRALSALEIDFVVVSTDDLLSAGVSDRLRSEGFEVFGPSRAAAKIEWSKSFAKEIMTAAGVPHAQSMEVTADTLGHAVEWLGLPLVIKVDGLALGKGVKICETETHAREALEEFAANPKFAAMPILAERFVKGLEASFFALCDGSNWRLLEPACDHKRLLENDLGPNTGGMGAISPVPWLSRAEVTAYAEQVFEPVLKVMRERGTPFSGLLYAGLMISQGDSFNVLEFNARFGDPETQAILPRMKSDFLSQLIACAHGTLENAPQILWSQEKAVHVVAASEAYPAKPVTGKAVRAIAAPDVAMTWAGVTTSDSGGLVTSGGRVFGATALGASYEIAREKALDAISARRFDGMQVRSDIGLAHERVKRVVVFASGRGTNFKALCEAADAKKAPIRVVALVSDVPGCGAEKIAQEKGVPVITVDRRDPVTGRARTRSGHEALIDAKLSLIAHDWICLAGYMRIFSPEFVRRHPVIVNIHPSLLPEFKGTDAYGQALRASVKRTGATVHLVTEALDDGPVLAQAPIDIFEDDTLESLTERGLQIEHRIYAEALKKLAEERA